ncbi:type II toxin-antitoxin system RelE/ParE family toxin [Gimesia aquarii]|uniref:Plasmid maintenance system killer protein n=1 Tax=Gimesia aquarii TaxID=2527964 RepID=A0A517VTD8_9PLAN|nr:type II toxin-antitoxin system RelE/ParE family toxin [Gimesia aquarii]QDT96277.1 Plasmid maintenance system killer protein [Gimesia aquarii]
MEVDFEDDELQELENNEDAKSRLDDSVIRAFRKRMRFLRDAVDERDLREMKSLHFKKLKGDRDGQYSIRLNDQWRLIIQIEFKETGNVIRILKIEDYH